MIKCYTSFLCYPISPFSPPPLMAYIMCSLFLVQLSTKWIFMVLQKEAQDEEFLIIQKYYNSKLRGLDPDLWQPRIFWLFNYRMQWLLLLLIIMGAVVVVMLLSWGVVDVAKISLNRQSTVRLHDTGCLCRGWSKESAWSPPQILYEERIGTNCNTEPSEGGKQHR